MELQAYQEMIELQQTHWWFCARRKILSSLLQKYVPVGNCVLEVGAGTGANLALLEKWGTVTALEPNPFAANYLSQHFNVKIIRESLPTARKTDLENFDLIAALDVLEHIKEEDSALNFIYQRLRPGGRAIITVPAFDFLWSSHDETLHHQRRYLKSELANKMKSAGLKIEFQSYFNFFLLPPALFVRLMDKFFKGLGQSGTKKSLPAVNHCLKFIFGLESHVLRLSPLPFGLSIVIIGSKYR